jgi:membrane protein
MLRTAAREWWEDDVFESAAALAFYTIFSMAPIVTIALWIAGLAFGSDAATRALVSAVESLVGPKGSVVVEAVVDGLARSPAGLLPRVLALATLILGSTAVFGQLQKSLNRFWDVRPTSGGHAVRHFLKKRLLSFGLVIALGFMLLVSLVASAVLTALQQSVSTSFPLVPWIWRALDLGISFALASVLFSAVYKLLPDARIGWSDVLLGGAVTALLFSIGKLAIGVYLGRASFASAYGAAGSFVVLVVWVYYTAIVCFFGAELTQAFARRDGTRIVPEPYAVRVGEKRDDAAG